MEVEEYGSYQLYGSQFKSETARRPSAAVAHSVGVNVTVTRTLNGFSCLNGIIQYWISAAACSVFDAVIVWRRCLSAGYSCAETG